MSSPELVPLRPWQVFVPGRPAPKGSSVQWRNADGRTIFKQSSAKHLRPWNDAIRLVTMARRPAEPFAQAVSVQLLFRLEQPKTNRDAKPMRRGTGDLDKLTRAVFDALVDHVIADDSLVVQMGVAKEWAESRNAAGVWITIKPA